MDDYQIPLHSLEGELASKAIEIAMREGVTIYDASYIALALLLDTLLYTAGEKLERKAQDRDHLKHIRNYSPSSSTSWHR